MNNVLTFYSVDVQQVNALEKAIGKPNDEGVVTGDTPLGKIAARVNYQEPSRQLQVEVLEKPHFVSIQSIESKIRAALDNAANEAAGLAPNPEPPPAPQKPAAKNDKGCKDCPDEKKADAKADAKPADAKSEKPTESQAPAKTA